MYQIAKKALSLFLAVSLIFPLVPAMPGTAAGQYGDEAILSEEPAETEPETEETEIPAETAQVRAADAVTPGNGLMTEWYKAKDGDREDINRFEFVPENLLRRQPIADLSGTRGNNNLKPIIRDILGSNDDSQFVLASFTGELEVPADDNYTFYLEGDDGFRLYIDDNLVIDFWYQRWEIEQTSPVVPLEAGRHDIRIEYLQGWGGAYLLMQWSSDSFAKEVVPESALFRKRESYYIDKLDELQLEIDKCEIVYDTYKDTVPAVSELRTAITAAEEAIGRDFTELELQDILDLLDDHISNLIQVKTSIYLQSNTQPDEEFTQYQNPLYQGQDPFVAQKDGFFYYVASSNDDSDCRLYISKSRTLTDQGEKVEVLNVEGKQRRVFAPELFFFEDENDPYGGRWYIYYCADVVNFGRDYPEMAAQYTIAGQIHIGFCARSMTDDPLGAWEDPQPLYLGEDNKIFGANDLTVIKYDGSYFAIWGTLGPPEGQPAGPAIVEMDNPYTVTNDRDMLPIGGGEGPRALTNADGDLFITMSEGDYQSNGYRLSLLCFTGTSKDELLDDTKWYAKRDVFTSTTAVSGPARASFIKSPDGTEDWMVYHSRVYKEVGRNSWRQVNIQKFTWNEDGTPEFGKPVSPNKYHDLPSGDPGQGTMYQAENAILENGPVVKDENRNYSGDAYVHIPNRKGATVSFVVHAPADGDYIVGTRYAFGEQKDNETTHGATIQLPGRASMNIYVNGERRDTLLMDKTSVTWNECFTGSKRLTLSEGMNLITYTVDAGCVGNVHFDYISVHEADVPFTEAAVIPKSLTIKGDSYSLLKPGETVQIQAALAPANAADQLILYTSANPNVAKVDTKGKITAVAPGRTQITAAASANKKAKAEYTVVVAKADQKVDPPKVVVKPVYIEFSTKSVTLAPGKYKDLSAKIYPADAADKTITYSSANIKVATVDSKGRVTAKAAGTTTIKAVAAGDTGVIQTCTVKVEKPKTVKVPTVTRVKATRDKKKGYGKLTWKKASGVKGYIIYRSTKRNGTYKRLHTVPRGSATRYIDKTARKNRIYYYKVKAYKKSGSKTVKGNYSRVAKLQKIRK